MKYTDLLVVHGGLIGATPGHHRLSEPGIDLLRQRASEPEELDDYLAAEAESKSSSDQQPQQKVHKSSSAHSHSSSVSSTSSDGSSSSDSQKRPEMGKRWGSSWRDLKTGLKHHGHSHSRSDSK